MYMKKQLLFLFLIVFTLGISAQTIIYVKPSAMGSGSSWGDASDLEEAVKNATSNTHIWVQAGTYFPKTTLIVPIGAKIFGGFQDGGNMSNRDWLANPTIINAENKFGSVVQLGASAVIDGFTIKNGSAKGNTSRNGGGIWADDNTTIQNCSIVNNSAILNGGGIYATTGTLTIIDCIIRDNTAIGSGNNIYGCCITIEGGNCIPPVVCTDPSARVESRTHVIDPYDFPPLSVAMLGTEPFTYQWYVTTTNVRGSGTVIDGATSSSYIPDYHKIGAHYYYVVVENACGKDTSRLSGLHTVTPYNVDYSGVSRSALLLPGVYRVEAWGGQGGDMCAGWTGRGGRGGYTAGDILVYNPLELFIYVGGAGRGYGCGTPHNGGWNGGGNCWSGGSSGGGGASDIRVVGGAWNDVTSLRNRIMVAAGGGGSNDHEVAGFAGGLLGGAGQVRNAGAFANGATQTAGGTGNTGGANGGFGFGGGWDRMTNLDGGGGGSGWYGGGQPSGNASSGAGGSSFISGHPGTNPVGANGVHLGTEVASDPHFSGHVFTNTKMFAGNVAMPNSRGNGNTIGNSGHGFVRITKIDKLAPWIPELPVCTQPFIALTTGFEREKTARGTPFSNVPTVDVLGTTPTNYQWFSTTVSGATTGGTLVHQGATAASFTPPVDVASKLYYYVVVTNECGTASASTGLFVVLAPGEVFEFDDEQ
jgi:predicted outer membrane repeat protein